MAAESRNLKGTWTQRFLIRLFTVGLAVLSYWLIGFVVNDIGSWPGPSYEQIERELLDPKIRLAVTDARKKVEGLEQQIQADRTRQDLLHDSANSSQTTINQLLSLQKLSLERAEALPDELRQNLADSLKLFLSYQRENQQLNDELTRRNEELNRAKAQLSETESALTQSSIPVQSTYQRLMRQHSLKIAMAKLAVLVPLLIIAVVLFLRLRGSQYAPLIYASGAALVIKVGVVMHEYFPAEYFKYVLILVLLAVVLWCLVKLLHSVARPHTDWLMKQYREAYELFLCPVCDFPIRRGPHRFLYWTRTSLKRLSRSVTAAQDNSHADEAYTCPSCGTALFEECPACHGMRHALLPTCQHCGVEHSIPSASANSAPAPRTST